MLSNSDFSNAYPAGVGQGFGSISDDRNARCSYPFSKRVSNCQSESDYANKLDDQNHTLPKAISSRRRCALGFSSLTLSDTRQACAAVFADIMWEKSAETIATDLVENGNTSVDAWVEPALLTCAGNNVYDSTSLTCCSSSSSEVGVDSSRRQTLWDGQKRKRLL